MIVSSHEKDRTGTSKGNTKLVLINSSLETLQVSSVYIFQNAILKTLNRMCKI